MSGTAVQFDIESLLASLKYAAEKHASQFRKKNAGPYINHPIAVAEVLARIGKVSELESLQAALLHDVLEDTETPPAELEELFGANVRSLVEEVTDDMDQPKADRKRKQIETAPSLSLNAKRIRIADKICNVSDISSTQPSDWSPERKQTYFDWAEQVVQACHGASPELEQYFVHLLQAKRAALT